MLNISFNNVQNKKPLVHNITNYVTVNDCANVVLACGASPIMADDEAEVCDITSICNALVINIGTLNSRTVESMIKAGKRANEISNPIIFDPVGVGASALRNETAFKLLEEVKFSVIRGNISEIKFLATGGSNTQGVDASELDMVSDKNIEEAINFARDFSIKTGAVITITGAIDLVVDKDKAYVIRNGHPLMSKVTGTGCMLSSMIGSYIGANENIIDAVATAVCIMGLSGELAYKNLQGLGTGSYKTLIIDHISNMNNSVLKDGAKIESR